MGTGVVVTGLAVVPVKGMRLVAVDAVELGPAGARGDREFFVRDPRTGRIALTGRHGALVQVVPAWDGRELALTFPGGRRVAGPVEHGEAVETAFYDGREVPGRVVAGPFAEAIGEHLGKPVQLVARDPGVRGADDSPVTLMSEASLRAVGGHLGAGELDGRRFRMTLTVDGVDAWAEHGWGGRVVRVGGATLRVDAPVVRCVITTRDPDSGRRDQPVLKALAELRGRRDVTFGVWLDVVQPGPVRLGDAVTLAREDAVPASRAAPA